MIVDKQVILFEILVPIVRPNNPLKAFTRKKYKKWKAKVLEISGGLTTLDPIYGEWTSGKAKLVIEKMLPVRIACSNQQIIRIADITAKHFKQEAVMYYLISKLAVIRSYKKEDLK